MFHQTPSFLFSAVKEAPSTRLLRIETIHQANMADTPPNEEEGRG